MKAIIDFFKTLPGTLVLGLLVGTMLSILTTVKYSRGYTAGGDAARAAWHEERAELAAQNLRLTAQVTAQQHTIDTQAINLERQSHEQKQNLQADMERRLAGVRAGSERVYIPAKVPASAQCASAGAAGIAAGHGEARAELDAATVAALAGIARDGDACIIDRNELIDRYNAARAALLALDAGQNKAGKPGTVYAPVLEPARLTL